MRTNDDCIVSAAMIIYGEWIDIAKIQIPYFRTPEDLLIEKEETELDKVWLRSLSQETQELVTLIASCPEEIFQNGRLVKHKLYAACLIEKNWDYFKVRRMMKEVVRTMRT